MVKNRLGKLACGPALIGLLGAVVGGLVTGFFQLQAQRMSSEKALELERAQGSRVLALDLAKTSAEYLAALTSLTVPVKGEGEMSDNDVTWRKLQVATYELSLKTSPPTALKLLRATSSVAHNIASSTNLDSDGQATEAIADAYIALYLENSRYRLTSVPGAAQSELLATVIQLLPSLMMSEDK